MQGRDKMSVINILHLVNDFSDSSISRIILRLISNIGLKDVCWHIGGLNGQGEINREFSRLEAQIVDFSGSGVNNANKGVREIREYILSNEIKIVHTHTPRTIFSAFLALQGSPNITHLATKHLLTSSADRKWGVLFALMDRLSLYFPDRLVPVSYKMYQQIITQPGVKKSRVTMIRNAVPNEQFYVPEERAACRAEFGLPSNSIILGYIGRIQRVKRIDLLLEAFSQISKVYPSTRLVIVGDGEAKPQLESYAVALGVSNKIIWTGFRRDIPRILAALDVYVQTSSNEGLSLSILEAMAAGKPIIATDVGGNSEIIRNEVTGLLLANGSVDEIVKAASNLLNHPKLMEHIALAGLKLVQNEFSLNSMVAGYRHLYDTVLSEKTP